ncbi:hypothetical protein EBU71_19535, partial [bacterium]|nr:hypothetical protein [Candidatus Elulimicrobium humile]
MIILIPLGGKGQRFRDHKYSVPKALIEVEGKPIIFWLLDNMLVKFPRPDDLEYIYIPYHRDYDDHDFENKVRERYPDVKFKFLLLSKDTEGAAHTINIALKNIINNEDNNQDKAVPIICIDSDNFYTADIISLWNRNNMIFTFYDYGGDPKFSYIDYDYHGVITNIVEKEYIDPGDKIACTGAYGFASVHDLYKYSSYIMEKKWCFKDEYYISTVIDAMLGQHKFTFHTLDNKDYFSLGTPEQVRAFEHVFLFDLDGTLVNTDALYIYIWNRIMATKYPNVPLTIDADGINILSKNPALKNNLPKDVLLTPHHGEWERLFFELIPAIQDRLQKKEVLIVGSGTPHSGIVGYKRDWHSNELLSKDSPLGIFAGLVGITPGVPVFQEYSAWNNFIDYVDARSVKSTTTQSKFEKNYLLDRLYKHDTPSKNPINAEN